MTRRSRSEIFQEITNAIKKRKLVVRAELCREVLTDTDLFNLCVDAMKETGMVKSSYVFTPTGRQREMLEATNLDNSELFIRALSKVLAPSLREMFDEWYCRRHQAAEPHLTTEELEKKASAKRTFNLVRRSFSSERAREEV